MAIRADIPNVEGEPVTPEDFFWQEIMQNLAKDSVTKIEDAAKQLVPINTLLATIYFAVVSFTDLHSNISNLWDSFSAYSILQNEPFLFHVIYKWFFVLSFSIPILTWILSLYYVSKVLKPVRYHTDYNSPSRSRKSYEYICDQKYKMLQQAYRPLILGLLILFINIFIYLSLII